MTKKILAECKIPFETTVEVKRDIRIPIESLATVFSELKILLGDILENVEQYCSGRLPVKNTKFKEYIERLNNSAIALRDDLKAFQADAFQNDAFQV